MSEQPSTTSSASLSAGAAPGRHRVSLADLEPPIALGPLDGRYRGVVAPLVDHLSEAALNRARLDVEVSWLVHLTTSGALPGAPQLSDADVAYLRGVVDSFGAEEIAELAEIERETRHDVKAVEYFLKRRLAAAAEAVGPDSPLPAVGEIVHIFCTSEDVNNLSYAVTIRDAVRQVWLPAAIALVGDLADLARETAEVPMLSRTHGQTATPTTLGKEVAVLAARLRRQLRRVSAAEFMGKLNGATGTYGAHAVSVPQTDWQAVSRSFVEGLGLTWNPLTTQIEPHDWQAELYADIARFNRVLHNLCTDVWTYISLGYFRQRLAAQGSTGSSTMPHKVNPIRFENAEANLEVSSALLDTLGATLVTSRLQRDLTDSTTQRNIGVALGHSLLAVDNVRRGLAGLDVDAAAMERDLDDSWEVLGEAVQSAMRAASVAGAEGMADPYERLKELTRGRRVDAEGMRGLIAGLGLPRDVEQRLLGLTPATYTGLAAALVAHLDDVG
ncbi:Adenylosuccinate lyase [Georgenia satyanarayanai]|uniref:Adenylosuccinate lyase n=1 Tax=Georgenia satyanarayanai TaxID=860221 RepID=A0A2Y9AIL6_9MICO|nr:adenylosuccinate lyase [Georgenia satyanarayanai]PYF99033.1 adenylosuccinate lyase [Georgenia satyanarayanai]SSA43995.1 Adenylosuccinate lyase [Georgenia satyanarayanai]